MELVDTLTDVPEFDAVWLDYCKYWNATAATYVFHNADPLSLLTVGLVQSDRALRHIVQDYRL